MFFVFDPNRTEIIDPTNKDNLKIKNISDYNS
jgi:hypothetical protein